VQNQSGSLKDLSNLQDSQEGFELYRDNGKLDVDEGSSDERQYLKSINSSEIYEIERQYSIEEKNAEFLQ